MGGNSIAENAPPLAHAIGGSIGSALALLLLYPLERARVELQTMTASATPPEDINDKVTPLLPTITSPTRQTKQQRQPHPSRGGCGAVMAAPPLIATFENDEKETLQPSSSEESWESCIAKSSSVSNSMDEMPSDSSDEEAFATTSILLNDTPSITKDTQSVEPQKKHSVKMGLLACIYQLHQKRQLYRGVAPVITTMAASNFVFFYMHSFLKQWLIPNKKHHPTVNNAGQTLRLSLLASSLAGIVNVLLTNPMWVANLRIVTSDSQSYNNNNAKEPCNNLFQEIKHIVETEGWAHLWSGTPASLLLVSNPVIQFVAYEQLKQHVSGFRNRKGGPAGSSGLNPLEAFLLGALAKAISTVLTYPLQLAQTVLRVQKQERERTQQLEHPLDRDENRSQVKLQRDTTHSTASLSMESSLETQQEPRRPKRLQQPSIQQGTATYKGTVDCLIQIYRRKGLEGWFAGMRTKLLQTVLTAAFTFLTYEQIIGVIMAVHRGLASGHGGGRKPIAARAPSP